MDPYPSIVIFLLLILLSSLLTAGRTALTQLRDSSVKKMASSERGGERFIARLLERPAAFLDGVELARFACTVAAALFTYPLALVPLTWLVRSLSFSRSLYYAFSFDGDDLYSLDFRRTGIGYPIREIIQGVHDFLGLGVSYLKMEMRSTRASGIAA